MKILHTSDWHLGKSLYDFSLLDDQRHALDFLLGLIAEERIDAVIISGDVYDRPIPSAEAVRLYDYFLTRAAAEIHVPVIAIAGNHDSPARLEFGSRLYSGAGYHIFGSIKSGDNYVSLHDDFGEVRFYPIPWLHPAEIRVLFDQPEIKTFDSAYKFICERYADKLDTSIRNVAIAHSFFAGISSYAEKELVTSDSELNVGGMDIADSAYFSPFDYTALGHLHMPQRAGCGSVRYSGSPLKYSLSEERQKKSCTILELKEKGHVDIDTVEIPALRDVRTVSGSFDSLMDPDYHQNKCFGDYVFADITDSGVLYPMEKLRTLFPNLLGLRFVTAGDSAEAFEINALSEPRESTLELFKRFYRDTYAAEIPEEHLDFLREILKKSEEGRE